MHLTGNIIFFSLECRQLSFLTELFSLESFSILTGADPDTLRRRGDSRDSSEKGAAWTLSALFVNFTH